MRNLDNIIWGKSARDRKIKSAYEQIEKILEDMPNTDVVWILEKLKMNALRSGEQ